MILFDEKYDHIRDRTPELTSALAKDGVVIVRDVFDRKEVEQPKHDFLSMFNLLDAGNDSDFDECYENFWLNKPHAAVHSLSLARDLPSFLALVSSQRIRALMATIFGSTNLICPFDWCLFRVDGPSTATSRFEWHQDYPYNVISTAALTFWIALSDMSEDMGLLKFVPGSHGDIHPVEINRAPEHNNPNRLRIADLERKSPNWEGAAISAGQMNAGDVILFNSLLVHRSGHNQSQKYRWVANGRYARADDAQFIARDYHTARLKYPYYFETAHPDLVVS